MQLCGQFNFPELQIPHLSWKDLEPSLLTPVSRIESCAWQHFEPGEDPAHKQVYFNKGGPWGYGLGLRSEGKLCIHHLEALWHSVPSWTLGCQMGHRDVVRMERDDGRAGVSQPAKCCREV